MTGGKEMEFIKDLLESLSDFTTAFTIIFAVLSCFFGYKLLKIWIGLAGFLIGLLAGFGVAMQFVHNVTLAMLIGACVGAVCAFLAFRIYLVGVFVLVFFWVYTMARLIPQPVPGKGWQMVMIGLAVVLGILGGMLAVKFTKPAVICLSAFSGGTKAIHYLLPLLGVTNSTILWIGGIILAVAGGFFQLQATKKMR